MLKCGWRHPRTVQHGLGFFVMSEEAPVLTTFVTRISSIEIPVSDLEKAVEWYKTMLGLSVTHQDEGTAMLSFDAVGVPGLFLVQTDSRDRLTLLNSNTHEEHSVIDFYTCDLEGCHHFLKEHGVRVGPIRVHPEYGVGGFGFEDPDGNRLSACKVIQRGQE